MNSYDFSFFSKRSLLFTKKFKLKSVSFSAFIIFGLPLYLLFITILIIKREVAYSHAILFYSLFIAGFWILLGPLLIVVWELSFVKYLNQISKKVKQINSFKTSKIDTIYFDDRLRYWVCYIFALMFIFVIFCGIDSAKLLGLNNGLTDPIFWLTLLISIQCGFTAGFGFWGVFKSLYSILIIKKYYKIDFKIFNSDKVGGLGFVYKFILNTTYCFSAGSVIIPFGLQIASNSNPYVIISSYLLVFLYSLSIFVSFFFPCRIISNIIRKNITDKMEEISVFLNENYDKKTKPLIFNTNLITFQYLEKYVILPLDYNKISQFSFSFLLPIILLLIDFIISKT